MAEKKSGAYCPNNQKGLTGDDYTDTSTKCVLTGSADGDGKGWGYNNCDFKGDDYRECSRYKIAEEKTRVIDS